MTITPIGPRQQELAAAARMYEQYLAPAEMFDFDIAALDRLGKSVVVASLQAPDGFQNDGFGYGASAAEARVGALGEMSETFHVHRALMRTPACEGLSYAAMVARFGAEAVIDPLTLCLPAGSSYDADTPLRWVAVNNWPDNGRVWAPRECLAPGKTSYETASDDVVAQGGDFSTCLFTPITCGLGAGLSLTQALSHGVLELLQRDGNCTRFRAMDRGIDLELDEIVDPGVRALLAELAARGLRLRAKLASTEFDLVNLYVIGEPAGTNAISDFPLMLTACGEAVHANRERALRKALLEYIAARVRKTFMHGPLDAVRRIAPAAYADKIIDSVDPADEEPRALAAMVDWLNKDADALRDTLADSVFAAKQTVAFSELPSTADDAVSAPDDRLADLAARLQNQNLSIHYFDASPPGNDAPQVIKALVPGLEGETLSYYRIGERGVRRLAADGSDLVSLGSLRDDDRRVRLTAAAETRLGAPAYFSPARADARVGALYPLYREPGSHSAQKRRQAGGK